MKAAVLHAPNQPLTIEEIDNSTRISCGKCGKFIQGRFS